MGDLSKGPDWGRLKILGNRETRGRAMTKFHSPPLEVSTVVQFKSGPLFPRVTASIENIA